MNSSATVTVREVEVEFDYYATPYVPARMYLSNGDPGYPEEGGDFEIEAVRVSGVDITELLDNKVFEEIEQIFINTDFSDY